MNLEQIIAELKNERDRLDAAIKALESGGGIRTALASRGPEPPPKQYSMSEKHRRNLSKAARKRWAEARRQGLSTLKGVRNAA